MNLPKHKSPTGPTVPQTIIPAQGTASGSNTEIVTATSRETGIQWRSSSITESLPKYRYQKHSGRPALNSGVQSSGGGCWTKESPPGQKANRRSSASNPSATRDSGWPGDDRHHTFNAHYHPWPWHLLPRPKREYSGCRAAIGLSVQQCTS